MFKLNKSSGCFEYSKVTVDSESAFSFSLLECPQLKEQFRAPRSMKKKKRKTLDKALLLWLVIGCVAVVTIVVAIVVAIVLLLKEEPFARKQYRECWSSEPVWSDVTEISIPDNMCNGKGITEMDFSKYTHVEKISIGTSSFKNVKIVRMVGMKKLEYVVIGKLSFDNITEDYPETRNPNARFTLKDCPKMKGLTAGPWVFSDYTLCDIENTPSLEVIELGDYAFYWGSMELKSHRDG